MSPQMVLPDYAALKDASQIEAEWKRCLAAKDTEQPGRWLQAVARLRELAAVLRDAVLPLGEERARLEALVTDMSTHLPERRTAGR